MRSDNSQTNNYEFLNDSDVISCFADLDYRLRIGQHIQQQYRGQEAVFQLLEKYYPSLNFYYQELFGLSLEVKGSELGGRYYYLDLLSDTKQKIPSSAKQSMKKQYILIGIFLFKLEIDLNIVRTITEFKRMLREDYEMYKHDFFRLLTQVTHKNYTENDERELDKEINNAFDAFYRIGWIYRDNDTFEIMPSFERLRSQYLTEINNIDELLRYE